MPYYSIRPPGPGPLPAGEGWVRERRHTPPTPATPPPTHPSFPAAPPHRHSRESGNPPLKARRLPRTSAARLHRHSGVGRNPEPRPPLAGRRGGIAASVRPELVAGRTDAGRLGWLDFRWGCLPARRSSCDKLRTNGYHAGLLCRCHPSAHRQPRRRPIRHSRPLHRHSGAGRNPEPRPPLAGRWGVIAASVHPELVAGRTDAGRLGWLGFRWGCLPARRSSCDKLRTNGYHAGLLCRCHPSARRHSRRPTPSSFPRKRESTPQSPTATPERPPSPPPSFRRRPESRTPVSPEYRQPARIHTGRPRNGR